MHIFDCFIPPSSVSAMVRDLTVIVDGMESLHLYSIVASLKGQKASLHNLHTTNNAARDESAFTPSCRTDWMNSGDLELLCSALSIKEKERPVGTLDNNLKEKGERVLALCLVGKVLTTKVVNKEAFINVMNSIWRVREGVEIEALEGNVFAFHFKNTADKKLVQSGGPWTFDRAITALEEPTGTGDIEHMKFNSVEIWVQIHNLPLLCMTEDTCIFLGTMIGEVKDVDLLATKHIGGRFIRVRVVISTVEPLMRSLRVDLLGTGEITTMLLRYERLQDYCFKCSRLGHSFKECTEPGEGREATTEAMARLNGGIYFNRADQGNWRSGTQWKGTGKPISDILSGGRNSNASKNKGQVADLQRIGNVSKNTKLGGLNTKLGGLLQSLEPYKELMGKEAAINAVGGDKIAAVNFTARREIHDQSVKGEKKDKQLTPLVSNLVVDKAFVVGQTGESAQRQPMNVDKPAVSGPTSKFAKGQLMKVDKHVSSGPTGEPIQVNLLYVDQPCSLGPLITVVTDPYSSSTASSLKKLKTPVKWKRAARNKGGEFIGSESVTIQSAEEVKKSEVSNFFLGPEEDGGVGSGLVDTQF
ncbi:hypothetical protein EZV62_001716 [Acer yangbiense]|uniref:CCHC-type domain-containing protein n=1 Tax=Acer yangbiense TaxID=1000413 RepID=A0A5C7IUW9_9ROSI|nr:hypothetical protein EZV62_001716 [Acer yangbiense]